MFVSSIAYLGLLLCYGTNSLAGDWPQILGPDRNGRADGETLLEAWPADGPKTVWTYDLGEGYAGPAVVGQKVIVFHRVGRQERIEALDVKSGRSIWKTDFEATYAGGINPDNGPRCVPLVYDGSVYVYGAGGDLHAVELETGKKLWSRQAFADFNAEAGYFGAGSSPIAIGDKLLVNVGGRRSGAGIVAFNRADGKTAWKALNDDASYSSPTLAKLNGQSTAVFVTRLNCVAIEPQSGEVRFSFPFGKRGPTVNAATPLVFDGHLFLSASYGIGAVYAKIEGQKAVPVWQDDDTLSSQYATSVYAKGFLYGTHGREDVGDAELRCVEAATGKVRWSAPSFGIGNLIMAGDKLLILKIDGQLVLVNASSDKYQSLATSTVAKRLTRALPALANGRLYFRTSERGSKLHCLEVGTVR